MQFEAVKNEARLNRFVMTAAKRIQQMNAIGITSKSRRYDGTYAHSDIAMSFARVMCFWLFGINLFIALPSTAVRRKNNHNTKV